MATKDSRILRGLRALCCRIFRPFFCPGFCVRGLLWILHLRIRGRRGQSELGDEHRDGDLGWPSYASIVGRTRIYILYNHGFQPCHSCHTINPRPLVHSGTKFHFSKNKLFQNFVRCRFPLSQSTVTTVCPGPSCLAARTAATQFVAALEPINKPSSYTHRSSIK